MSSHSFYGHHDHGVYGYYCAPPGGYGGIPVEHGVLLGGNGAHYGGFPGGYGGIPGGYGGIPGGYGGIPGGYGGIHGGYGGIPGGYGGYVGIPSGYGYGMNQFGFVGIPDEYRSPAISNAGSQSPHNNATLTYNNSDKPGTPALQSKSITSAVVLDEYNSDIYMMIEPDGLVAQDIHYNGFEYLWAGCRATHGVRSGKAFYEVIILENLPVKKKNHDKPNVLRLGWSLDNGGDFALGESQNSYGFGGTGNKSHNNSFRSYGRPFGEGDIMTSYIDLEGERPTIRYAKNGKNLGVAFNLPSDCRNQTFYPHISVKNIKFSVNFGDREPSFAPIAGFTSLASLPVNSLIRCPMSGTNAKEDYEILMMVGLPGAGKTVWSSKWRKDNPEKRYTILGTNTIMDKMKVKGLIRRKNYHGRWAELIKRATEILNEMFKMASNRARNYILDQTNVQENPRKLKMEYFEGYKRVACVLVNDRDTLIKRTIKQEDFEGKMIPVQAIKELMANFSLPDDQMGSVFDEIRYVEADRETAKELVREYVNEGAAYKRDEMYIPRTVIIGAKRSRGEDDEGGSVAEDGASKRGRYEGESQSGGIGGQIGDRVSGFEDNGRKIKVEEKPRIKEERRSTSPYACEQRNREENVCNQSHPIVGCNWSCDVDRYSGPNAVPHNCRVPYKSSVKQEFQYLYQYCTHTTQVVNTGQTPPPLFAQPSCLKSEKRKRKKQKSKKRRCLKQKRDTKTKIKLKRKRKRTNL